MQCSEQPGWDTAGDTTLITPRDLRLDLDSSSKTLLHSLQCYNVCPNFSKYQFQQPNVTVLLFYKF